MSTGVDRTRPTRPRAGTRRVLVVVALVFMLTSVLVLLVGAARARDFAADRHRRAQEVEARELWLYRQLANKDAIHESQRQIYIARVRSLEERLGERDREIFVLRARAAHRSTPTIR